MAITIMTWFIIGHKILQLLIVCSGSILILVIALYMVNSEELKPEE